MGHLLLATRLLYTQKDTAFGNAYAPGLSYTYLYIYILKVKKSRSFCHVFIHKLMLNFDTFKSKYILSRLLEARNSTIFFVTIYLVNY